jgi:hypothetical protein
MDVERRGRLIVDLFARTTGPRAGRKRVGMSIPQDKPFDIPKRLVWEAYERVKANRGAAGVDGQSIDDFEVDLKNNLYRIWSASSRTGGEAVSSCS